MEKALILCLFLAACSPPQQRPAPQDEARDSQEESYLVRLAGQGDRLWTLSDNGRLTYIDLTKKTRVEQPLPEPGRDMCLRHGDVWTLTSKAPDRGPWTLRRLDGTAWKTEAVLDKPSGWLRGMDCTGDAVTILTENRISDVRQGRITTLPLSHDFDRGRTVFYKTATHLYVGVDKGEFGSGLYLIDRQRGTVGLMDTEPKVLCEGDALNRCHNIFALASPPWRKACLAIAVNMPMSGDSGIVELCGTRARELYRERLSVEEARHSRENGFYGLSAVGERLYAVGDGGLYVFHQGRLEARKPLPTLETIGGVRLTKVDTGVVLVSTLLSRHEYETLEYRLVLLDNETVRSPVEMEMSPPTVGWFEPHSLTKVLASVPPPSRRAARPRRRVSRRRWIGLRTGRSGLRRPASGPTACPG